MSKLILTSNGSRGVVLLEITNGYNMPLKKIIWTRQILHHTMNKWYAIYLPQNEYLEIFQVLNNS